MIYEVNKDNIIYSYAVTYDSEKLKEILEELKKYSYMSLEEGQMAGKITRFPSTIGIIRNRVVSFFRKVHPGYTIYPETIVHHTEDNNDYVSYYYSYNKLPDLYYYIDLIVNISNKSLIDYVNVFGPISGSLEQKLFDGILNYANSRDIKLCYKIGIDDLYKRTLKCFNFNLISVKRQLNAKEAIKGLSLKKKK